MGQGIAEHVLAGPAGPLAPGQHGRHAVERLPRLVLAGPPLLLAHLHAGEGLTERGDLPAHLDRPSVAVHRRVRDPAQLGVRGPQPALERPTPSADGDRQRDQRGGHRQRQDDHHTGHAFAPFDAGSSRSL